ncbi:MAG: T9SS type A sorting domain-containing protein [Bacteroidales bacterium]|nr:T9SS type A sorting domain-containing protein [Bacteroidales bacterium]
MKTKFIAVLIGLFVPFFGFNQTYSQYFDGADTSAFNSIFVQVDTSALNVWQIGPPQKIIFDSAVTFPNVIMTDTINFYPVNNTSGFQFTIIPWVTWGILAIQWMQKLDMDSGADGGVIEFSVDGGNSWENVFNNPYVYNFYGYDSTNVDTLPSGQIAFTGTDSTWKDLWLCYDMTWLSLNDSIMVRHTFISDSVDNSKEGWMIDNLLVHVTIIHTVNEVEQEEYLKIQPNPTTGKIDIIARKIDGFHIIEKMELIDMEGKVVQEFGISPTKFFIDIGHHQDGIYFLKIKTNLQIETFKVVLQH